MKLFLCLLILSISIQSIVALHPIGRPLRQGEFTTRLVLPHHIHHSKGCSAEQIDQAIHYYVQGQWNSTQGNYNFKPVYPFFNQTTPTAASLTVTDLYTLPGFTAITNSLNSYAPQFSHAYQTVPDTPQVPNPSYLEFNVNAAECRATALDFRVLQEFRYNRTQEEYLSMHFYFGSNVNEQNEHDVLFDPTSGNEPKVLLNLIHEFPNSGLDEYFFDYLHDVPAYTCGNYSQSICPSLVPNNFANYATPSDPIGCETYLNTLPYSYAANPGMWLPYGPTISCYNYYLTAAMNANWEMWGPLTIAQQTAQCFAFGQYDGQPGRACGF